MAAKKQTKKNTTVKKLETSKIILLVNYIIAIALLVVTIIGSFMGYDVTGITTVTALVFAEVGASNVYYYKKAAKENVPKILSSLSAEFRSQVDINQLLNQ